MGLDYYYSKNKFINASVGVIYAFELADHPLFGYLISRERESLTTLYADVSNNHRWNLFSLGYGLTYGYTSWNSCNLLRYDPVKDDIEYYDIRRKSHSLGFVLSAYYYTRGSFYLGLKYRPNIVQFTEKATSMRYQHTLSFELGWRIRLKK